jgi:hypothetical protein
MVPDKKCLRDLEQNLLPVVAALIVAALSRQNFGEDQPQGQGCAMTA